MPGDDVSMPTLMSAAQRTYLVAIQEALGGAGFGDVPPTGYRIVGALTRGGSNLQDLATRLAMSKQAVGRLADVLVARGYVTRTSDPADRRRVILLLTERGRAATEEARQAIAAIDQLVGRRVESHELATTRATLRALVSIGRDLRPGVGSGGSGDAS